MNIHVTSVHKGEKPFKCDICDYSCSRKGNLNRHVSMHEGNKPFKCDICGYSCSGPFVKGEIFDIVIM